MIYLSFGFEQIWFDYSRNFVKFDEAAVKNRDISEKQLNWKWKGSFARKKMIKKMKRFFCARKKNAKTLPEAQRTQGIDLS